MERFLFEPAVGFAKGSAAGTGKEVSVALVFPNIYFVGMSNLGFLTVYRIMASLPFVRVERVFLPSDLAAAYQSPDSAIRSVETGTPLAHFDIVAFSVPFENDYINLLKILVLGSIEPERKKRTDKDPLLIMGGICATSNPFALFPFIDIFFIGEAEELLLEFFTAYLDAGKPPAKELASSLSAVNGIYSPWSDSTKRAKKKMGTRY